LGHKELGEPNSGKEKKYGCEYGVFFPEKVLAKTIPFLY